jgi:hypothetical protein
VEVWIWQLASDTWREEAKRALTAAGLPALPHIAQAFEKVMFQNLRWSIE